MYRRDQRGAGEHDHPIDRRELHPEGQPGQLPAVVRDQHVRRRHCHGVPAGWGRPVDTMRMRLENNYARGGGGGRWWWVSGSFIIYVAEMRTVHAGPSSGLQYQYMRQ